MMMTPFVRLEAVHLDEQLIERLLALVVSAAEAGAAVTSNRVNLVDEDDARRVLLACSKRSRTRLAPTPTNISTKSEPEMLKKGTPASPAIARASSVLPVPGGPIIEHALRDAAAELLELLRILEEGDDLFDLVLGLVDASDIGEGDLVLRLVRASRARDLPKLIALPPPAWSWRMKR